MLTDHIEHLLKASTTDANDWLLKAAEGHLPTFSPLDEDTPATILARIYENAPALLRETLQLALKYWIGIIATSASEPPLSNATIGVILSLIDPILVAAPDPESTILRLRHIASSPNRDLRLYALKGLLALNAMMPASFWRERDIADDDRFVPILAEALARQSPIALFDWLSSASWSEELQRSLYATMPLLFQTWRNADISLAIAERWASFSQPAQAVLRIFLDQHMLPIPSPQDSTAVVDLPTSAMVLADSQTFASSALALSALGYLATSISGDRSPERLDDAITRVLQRLNGHSRPRLGWEFGRLLAQHEMEAQTHTTFASIWPAVVAASRNDSRAHRELFAAHVLRGRTSYLAHSVKISQSDIISDIYYLSNVADQAAALARLCQKAGVSQFILAESEFHEDRIFCGVVNALLEENGLLQVRVGPRKWGGLRTYDQKQAQVGFVNTSASRVPQPEYAVYRFRRYHAFLRRDWAKVIIGHTTSTDVRDAAELLLTSDDAEIRTQIPLTMRGWLALAAGLARQIEEDFGLGSWLRAQENLSISAHGPIPSPSMERFRSQQTYGERLEAFLAGDLDVFIGGALHAELLNTWWSGLPAAEFVEILSPADFGQLGDKHWPPANVLDFDLLSVSDTTAKQIKVATVKLYREVRKLLERIAEQSKNAEAQRLLAFTFRLLAPSNEEEKYGRNLSFATPQSIVPLLASIEPLT